MLDDLITHGQSILRRLEAEALAVQQGEWYPDSRRVPTSEGSQWTTGVREFFMTHESKYVTARYENAVQTYRERTDGSSLEQARDFTAALLVMLQDERDRGTHPPVIRAIGSTDEAPLTWDLFISHASEDKHDFVKPLATELVQRGLSLWLDESTLRLGDSLRRSIDRGLANSRYGVVVLSRAFFSKDWPQRELDGLVARETTSGNKAILPVWYDIDQASVLHYSPLLADRLAIPSSRGIAAVATAIVEAIE